ncbi:hypothetical protein [Nostoc sp. MS1]|nr:hypothetical protein [Nostoc sp. MS1]
MQLGDFGLTKQRDLFCHATSLKSGNPPTRVAPPGAGLEPKIIQNPKFKI